MFDLLNNKPIWNLYEWYIETNNIQGQKYFLVGISDQYERGYPIRSSVCNKIDFENCMAETKNSYYKLCAGNFASRPNKKYNPLSSEWHCTTQEQICKDIEKLYENCTKELTDEQKISFKNDSLLQSIRLLVLNEMDSRKWDTKMVAEYLKVDIFDLHNFLANTQCINVSTMFISKMLFFSGADITSIQTNKTGIDKNKFIPTRINIQKD